MDFRGSAEIISRLCGWLYVTAWALSCYPQTLSNIRRRTTLGLTPDFPLLNLFGFACYTFSTALFLYSSTIRRQYADRHPLSPVPTVRFNDLVFGLHVLIICVILYSQFWPRLWGWEKNNGVQRNASKVTLGVLWGGMSAIGIVAGIVLTQTSGENGSSGRDWQWIDVVYSMTYVKLVLTIFKYIPQVVANYRRKSTLGWSIMQQLLDLTGGLLSLLQLVIDCSLQADWSGLTGNPVKLGLANITLVFDMTFIVQHYILYGPVEEKAGRGLMSDGESEYDPLLPPARQL